MELQGTVKKLLMLKHLRAGFKKRNGYFDPRTVSTADKHRIFI